MDNDDIEDKPPTIENLNQLSKITTRYNKWLN
jgi:Leucine-rich repeat (LRR) protein